MRIPLNLLISFSEPLGSNHFIEPTEATLGKSASLTTRGRPETGLVRGLIEDDFHVPSDPFAADVWHYVPIQIGVFRR